MSGSRRVLWSHEINNPRICCWWQHGRPAFDGLKVWDYRAIWYAGKKSFLKSAFLMHIQVE
jgi:hypothetical protein